MIKTLLPISVLITFTITYSNEISDQYGSGSSGILLFYQKYLSPAKGGNRCPMHPSCSQYAKQAVSENPVTGYFKTCDRLIRCGKNPENFTRDSVSGKLYDPLHRLDSIKKYDRKSEVHTVLDYRPTPTFADSFSTIDYFLFTDRPQQALTLSYQCMFSNMDSTHYEENVLATGKLHIIGLDFDGFTRFYNIFSYHKKLSKKNQQEMDVLLAKNFYLTGLFDKSLSSLGAIDTSGMYPALIDEVNFMYSLNYLQTDNDSLSTGYARKISDTSIRASFKKMCLTKESILPRSSFKNPILGGTLSAVLPGTGYAYAGRAGTALSSLVINALFIWTAGEAFYKKEYAIGTTATFLALGWYFGNIYGSINAVKERNSAIKNNFIKKSINQ